MDRIDFIHKVVEDEGADIFYSREGKLKKALGRSALESKDVDAIVDVCMVDRKITKAILTESDISKTRDLQKELVVKYEGKSIQALKDVHTAIHNYGRNEITETEGEMNDGRFVYSVVPSRKQCLCLEKPLAEPAFEIEIPDTVCIGKKDYKIVNIADRCFEGNTRITSVRLPSNLETIGSNTFCNCSSLSKVELPRHLKSIGNNAFAYTTVESLAFQDYLEEIGDMAFYKCRKLKTVSMTKRTSQIGTGAFSGCQSLEAMDIEDRNGRFMFEGGVLYSRKQDRIIAVAGAFKGKLTPPRSLLAIEQYAAEDCSGITELDLPPSLTTIGAYAFRNCTSLSKVKFPNSIERIGEKTFEGCTSIGSADIPASITSIGKMAFGGCTGIEVASIDGNVKFRDLRIFEGCSGLNRVTVRKGSDFTDKDFPKGTRVKFAHE